MGRNVFVKDKVFAYNSTSTEELKHKITEIIHFTDVQMLRKVFQNLLKWAMACWKMGEGYFEYLS